MYIRFIRESECVAQSVEHLTFNQRALGSSPSTLTIQVLVFQGLIFLKKELVCRD